MLKKDLRCGHPPLLYIQTIVLLSNNEFFSVGSSSDLEVGAAVPKIHIIDIDGRH